MAVQDYPEFEDGQDCMEYDTDFEDSKDILISALYEEEPQDSYQLEDMTDLDKSTVDLCLRELGHQKIVLPKYVGEQLSSGVVAARCMYSLNPLWRTVYSIVFDSERR